MESLPETYKAIVGDTTGPSVKDVPLPKPGKNQVLVKIAFAPINPSDLGVVSGRYPGAKPGPTNLVGFEGSGVITAVGEDLRVPHKVGDRVHVLGKGTWGQFALTDSEKAFAIHGDLSLEDAAPHFVNPGTVVYMGALAEKGGHKAAIHTAGSSALGRMLIRYFKQKGIKLINVVRREEYVEELKKEGADYVLNSKAEDFDAQLKEIAVREEATIAFDAIAGDFTNKVISAQPPNSTCYVYGGLGGHEVKLSIGELFNKKSVTGLYLTHHVEEVTKNGKALEFFNEIHSNLGTTFKSSVQKVFKLEEFGEAFAYYKENSSKGKILFHSN